MDSIYAVTSLTPEIAVEIGIISPGYGFDLF